MPRRSPKDALTREVVFDTALTLLDQTGTGKLTIRGLARELDRAPMTLYAHFASKEELLDRMFERIIHRAFSDDHHATWQAEFETACRRMRRLLLEHPHWVPLLARVKVPVEALEPYDRLLGLMLKDGFRAEAALLAFSAVMSHALGSVLVERMMDGRPPIPRQRLELVRGILTQMPAGAYPRIAAVMPKVEEWTPDRVFELGLRALIAGIDDEAPRRKGWRHHTRKARG